jgi:hypothetical protein
MLERRFDNRVALIADFRETIDSDKAASRGVKSPYLNIERMFVLAMSEKLAGVT